MTGIAAWIKGHRLITFFGLSYLLGWWVTILYWVGLWPRPEFIPAAPLVAAVVVIAVAEGRAGFRDLGARMIRWRVPWYWYAVALGLPLLVRFGSALVTTGTDGRALAWGGFAMAFLVRLVNPMDGPLGEEPGWRAFAVARMQVAWSPLASAIVLGVLVAGWHIPLVLVGDVGPVGLVTTFSITIVYVWIFNGTGGSALLTLLFHNVQGAVTIGGLGLTGAALVRQEFVECVVWSAAAAGVLVLNRSAWKVGAGSTTPRRADARQPRLDTRSRVRSAATAMSPARDAGGRDDRSGERVSAA